MTTPESNLGDSSDLGLPRQVEMLAYVEGELSGDDATALETSLSSRPELLERLHSMRDDRASLRDLPEVTAPSALVDDVLGQVERSMLLDDDPMAPPIRIARRGAWSSWPRYAAAATFAVLLSGALYFVYQALDLNSGGTGLENLANVPEMPDPALDVQDTDNMTDSDSLANASDSEEDATDSSDSAVDDASLVVADPGPSEPLDFGLAVKVQSRDLEAAMAQLQARLAGDGTGGVVANVAIGQALTRPIMVGLTGTRIAAVHLPAEVHDGPRLSRRLERQLEDNKDLLSTSVQLAAQSWGFQYTLVGRPSEIYAALNELHDAPEHRVNWVSRRGRSELLSIMAPQAPKGREWFRAMSWWTNPASNWPLAQRLVASETTDEPIIRIVLRVESR